MIHLSWSHTKTLSIIVSCGSNPLTNCWRFMLCAGSALYVINAEPRFQSTQAVPGW